MVRDIGLAEELAQEALLAALETWPGTGVPDNPGAWLMAAAKNRALDHFRRDKLLERKHEELAGEMELEQEMAAADLEAALIDHMDDDIGDDLLRLVFVACHPVLSTEARAALTRVGPSGEPILLLDQDRARWDHLLVRRGLTALERAERLGGRLGSYALQAAIAACHARARTAAETDWARIAALYDALAQLAP